ncbi:hypothetical protein BJX64DRAFT_292308 [Aspergillus heterothallicus]
MTQPDYSEKTTTPAVPLRRSNVMARTVRGLLCFNYSESKERKSEQPVDLVRAAFKQLQVASDNDSAVKLINKAGLATEIIQCDYPDDSDDDDVDSITQYKLELIESANAKGTPTCKKHMDLDTNDTFASCIPLTWEFMTKYGLQLKPPSVIYPDEPGGLYVPARHTSHIFVSWYDDARVRSGRCSRGFKYSNIATRRFAPDFSPWITRHIDTKYGPLLWTHDRIRGAEKITMILYTESLATEERILREELLLILGTMATPINGSTFGAEGRNTVS